MRFIEKLKSWFKNRKITAESKRSKKDIKTIAKYTKDEDAIESMGIDAVEMGIGIQYAGSLPNMRMSLRSKNTKIEFQKYSDEELQKRFIRAGIPACARCDVEDTEEEQKSCGTN